MRYCLILVSCLFALLGPEALAQAVVFDSDSIYTGRLQQSDGPFTYTYAFTVAETAELTIDEIKPGCACSLGEYPKEKLMGGQSGNITLSFDPYRPGPFHQIIMVSYTAQSGAANAQTFKHELILAGYVEIFEPDPSMEFPYVAGNLRLANKRINLGTIGDIKLVRREVPVYNAGEQAITFADSLSLPKHIEVLFEGGRTLAPLARGRILLFYDPAKHSGYGYFQDTLYIETNDGQTKGFNLVVATSVSKTGEVLEGAPRLNISADTVNMGRQSASSLPIVPFSLQNLGKDTLHILKLEPNIGCEVISIERREIPSYGSANMNLKLTDIGRKGKQSRQLVLFTNDPTQAVKTLFVLLDVY